ncbi:MAG: hypothetical protein ACXADH_01490, partial [Candidatus Kariarchaeaceae archaeon]
MFLLTGISSCSQRMTRNPFSKLSKQLVFFFLVSLLFSSLVTPGLSFGSQTASQDKSPDHVTISVSEERVSENTISNEEEKEYVTKVNKVVTSSPDKVGLSPDFENKLLFEKQGLAKDIGGLMVQSHTVNYDVGCINPTKDVLLVSHNQFTDYLTDNGYTFDSIDEYEFSTISLSTVMEYRIIVLEPDWIDYANLQKGLEVVSEALNLSSCLVISVRAAGNQGSQLDIDFLGTDYDRTSTSQKENFVNSSHPFISAIPWEGVSLVEADFNSWGSTDHGFLYNLPTSQKNFHEILFNSNGISMMEYDYANGFVLVDSLTSINGGWGTGNIKVANNFINYLNYSSYRIQSPILVSHPENYTYREFTSGNDLIWELFDSDPKGYDIYFEGTKVDAGFWDTTTPIIYNVDGLGLGEYNVTMFAYDLEGHTKMDTVFVTVIDGTPPVFSQIANDMIYAFGSTGNQLLWNATDELLPGSYKIWQDNSLVDFGPWANPTLISMQTDGLPLGNHNFTVEVFDAADNVIRITAFVTVVDDNEAPFFTAVPGNTTYNEGLSNNEITWVGSDLFADTFQLLRNEIQIHEDTWDDGVPIIINTDGLSKGIYNYTLILSDTSGNVTADTAFVHVTDNIAPVFISVPSNFTYEEGSTGNLLSWIGEDNHPSSFLIYREGTLLFSAGWSSGNSIEINIDGLVSGTYNYTLVLSDTSTNTGTNTTFVTVEDPTNPTINQPDDVSYEMGSSSNQVSWIGNDSSPSTYSVLKNGSLFISGFWLNGTPINVNVDGFNLGIYNLTIILWDNAVNSVEDTIVLTVVDTTKPDLDHPTDVTYEETTTGHFLNWTANDLNPSTYNIYRNGSLISSGGWNSEVPIKINIDGLSLGVYNYT